ncbi:methyl-accepting chemotaxis protein [Paenibacillus hexagrammi]|uniref:Methyl-accepting chemotaxis protein n=1 Tax=Paenibacillus hexagrammi TaxID=2908839 RepID=A0ABY3SHN1_9BACL|nr:methyl-accepting chemotaxis protein [Paenibacillus sp. YPD9-1]UJF32998.1 methyl-accepting chemotaxis protein [Paenibacillus sp. YPD9-1]
MTIRKKLLTGISAIMLLFVLTIASTTFLQIRLADLTKTMIANKDKLTDIEKLHYLARTIDDRAARYLLSSDQESLTGYENSLQVMTDQLQTIQNQDHDDTELQAINEFQDNWKQYLANNDATFALHKQGSIEKAQSAFIQNPLDSVLDPLITYRSQITDKVADEQQELDAKNQLVATISPIITVTAILLGITLALMIAKGIARPIQLVSRQLKEIAEGEADLTKTITVRSKDEVGDLAAYFNQMLGNLRSMIEQIGDSAVHVSASSEQLNNASAQGRKSSERMHHILYAVAQVSHKQVSDLRNNQTTIHEISTGIQQVAEHVQEVSQASTQSSQFAASGHHAIQTAGIQMKSIQHSIRDLSDVMHVFANRSKEIEQIIAVITEIAAQTNLLALNASIEAARAGEHGRGFTVVANEVKKLADQSSGSAGQITRLVRAIQNDTVSALHSMETSMHEVAAGEAILAEAGLAFGSIQQSVDGVASQVEEVSAAVEQIAASSQEIVNSMSQLAQVSLESAADTQSISASSEFQVRSMDEISQSAAALSQMSEQLRRMVQRFRV